jgi:hypothetical protein
LAESAFKFFRGVGPIHQVSATPPSEKPKPEARQLLGGFRLLSSINRDIPRFEQLGQKIEKKKMETEERRDFRALPASTASGLILLTAASRTPPWPVSGRGCRGRRFPRGENAVTAVAHAFEQIVVVAVLSVGIPAIATMTVVSSSCARTAMLEDLLPASESRLLPRMLHFSAE